MVTPFLFCGPHPPREAAENAGLRITVYRLAGAIAAL